MSPDRDPPRIPDQPVRVAASVGVESVVRAVDLAVDLDLAVDVWWDVYGVVPEELLRAP